MTFAPHQINRARLGFIGALGAIHDFLLRYSFTVLHIQLSPLLEEKSCLALKRKAHVQKFILS
jgi:hypothetical protein